MPHNYLQGMKKISIVFIALSSYLLGLVKLRKLTGVFYNR
jgi:hypothetical protein